MNYLPSKKIATTIVIVIILVGITFWVSERGKSASNVQNSLVSNSLSFNSLSAVSEKDNDNDNLANWEEALWGTDPENPDSDGDGTLDGEEVFSNRNPLIAGPDDSFQITVSENSEGREGELSLSGQFGVDFFKGYASLKARGYTREVSPDIFYQSITDNVSKIQRPDNFKIGDIRITDNSQSSIKNYGNNLGKIFLEAAENGENELEIIINMLEERSRVEAEKLKDFTDIQKSVLDSILFISAPSEAGNLHLALLNSYQRFVESLSNLSKSMDDPLVGIVGLGQYNQETESLGRILKDLKQYFLIKNVSFGQNESGFIFNNNE